MKKAWMTVLVIFIIPFVLCCNVDAASRSNIKAGKAYAKVLKRYLELSKYGDGVSYSYVEKASDHSLVKGIGFGGDYRNDVWDGYSNLFEEYFYMTDKSGLAYKIMDFNNDGVPELFVGNTKGHIYAAYTYNKGKVIYFGRDCALCKNGLIKYRPQAGDGIYVYYYKLTKNKKRKSAVLICDGAVGSWVGYGDKEWKRTTTENVIRLEKKYSRPLNVRLCRLNSKALRNIRKGKISYRGKKTYKLSPVPMYFNR